MTLFFVALACSVSVCWAEDVSAVIAISADGSELIYEMATVQKITFVQGAETSSMTIDRKGTHSDVTGLRCVMFGTRNLLPTELESVIDDDTKVYVFPNPPPSPCFLHLHISHVSLTELVFTEQVNE